MEIEFIENIGSTHVELIKKIEQKNIKPIYILYANNQYDGIGSRQNSWIGHEGNLYLSFFVKSQDVCDDVPKSSLCIYYAVLMQDILKNLGSKLWLKWPNDFYVQDKKIGGIMSWSKGDSIVVSMGLNLRCSPEKFGILDISINNHELVKLFCEELKKNISWKQVFSKFKIQFQKNKDMTFHVGDQICSLNDAELCDDGSIIIKGKKVYNLR